MVRLSAVLDERKVKESLWMSLKQSNMKYLEKQCKTNFKFETQGNVLNGFSLVSLYFIDF